MNLMIIICSLARVLVQQNHLRHIYLCINILNSSDPLIKKRPDVNFNVGVSYTGTGTHGIPLYVIGLAIKPRALNI